MHWRFCGAVIGCVQNVASLYWTWNRGVSNGPKSIHQQYPPKVLLTKLQISILGSWSHQRQENEIEYAFIIGIAITAGHMNCTILQNKAYMVSSENITNPKNWHCFAALQSLDDPSVWASGLDHCLKLVWTVIFNSYTRKNSKYPSACISWWLSPYHRLSLPCEKNT